MGLISTIRDRFRRRAAVRRYLDDLARDLKRRDIRLDELEGSLAAERPGFHDRIVSDVLERTDAILEELGRRIDEVAARTERDLAEMERKLTEIHERVARLRAVAGTSGNGDRLGADRAGADGAPPPASVAE
jgi:chromosome segregation ATPase